MPSQRAGKPAILPDILDNASIELGAGKNSAGKTPRSRDASWGETACTHFLTA